MAFDINTAKPIKQTGGFDLATAKPEAFVNEDVPTPLSNEMEQARREARPQPSFMDKVVGAGDAALGMAAAIPGAVGFGLGSIEGAVGELIGRIPEGQGVEVAKSYADDLTLYKPKTKEGQRTLKFITDKLGALPPVLGAGPAAGLSVLKAPLPKSKARLLRGVLSDEIKEGNVNAGNIAKALDVDGKLINNPRTKAAIKILGDNDSAYGTAINFEKMNDATRVQFNKMLDKIQHNKDSLDPTVVMENRAVNVIGDRIAERAIRLNDKKTTASKKLGAIVNGEQGNQKINILQARSDFINALSESDISVGKVDGKFKADTSRTLTNIGEVVKDNRLNNVLDRLSQGDITLKQAHKLKRNLRELVDFDPKAPGATKVSAEIESTIKNLASNINSQITSKNKSYGVQNKIMSESMDALKLTDKMLGKNLLIGDKLADAKLGALSKRIGTNLASKEDVKLMIDSLDESLAKRGVVLKDDIPRLVASLADLEKIFKLESEQAPFGFQSRVAKGTLEAMTTGTPTAALTGAALEAAKKLGKADFNDKMKALRMLSTVKKENKL